MKKLIILIFAFIGWVFCGAIMWIGMAVTSVETTLIIHLIGAPVVFAIYALQAIYRATSDAHAAITRDDRNIRARTDRSVH